MFLAYCEECKERFLLPVSHIKAVHNLAHGVIAVEVVCYEGHISMVMTGSDIDITGPATV